MVQSTTSLVSIQSINNSSTTAETLRKLIIKFYYPSILIKSIIQTPLVHGLNRNRSFLEQILTSRVHVPKKKPFDRHCAARKTVYSKPIRSPHFTNYKSRRNKRCLENENKNNKTVTEQNRQQQGFPPRPVPFLVAMFKITPVF